MKQIVHLVTYFLVTKIGWYKIVFYEQQIRKISESKSIYFYQKSIWTTTSIVLKYTAMNVKKTG